MVLQILDLMEQFVGFDKEIMTGLILCWFYIQPKTDRSFSFLLYWMLKLLNWEQSFLRHMPHLEEATGK